MGAFVTLNGRLTRDAKKRVVKTKAGDKTIHELSIVVNTFTGGKEFGTFYTVTLWENRFSGMVPYLKKGKSLIIAGSLYLNQYQTLGNECGSQLVIELSYLV